MIRANSSTAVVHEVSARSAAQLRLAHRDRQASFEPSVFNDRSMSIYMKPFVTLIRGHRL